MYRRMDLNVPHEMMKKSNKKDNSQAFTDW